MVCKPLERTLPHTASCTSSQTNLGNYKPRSVSSRDCEAEKSGVKAVCRFSLSLKKEKEEASLGNNLGEEKKRPQNSCDGHNDCGAGCLCLWSVAYCDHFQPVLLSAVLFASRTNCGLFFGGECSEQTRRHGSAEVKQANTTSLSPALTLIPSCKVKHSNTVVPYWSFINVY